ncbi:MAG: SusC/RagA family protein, partial [Bacteroidales bacterium]|nr:SusC/RagA family protein [Bacteroidales bacterium]
SVWTNQHTLIADRARFEVIDAQKTYTDGSYWMDDVTNVRISNSDTKTPRPSLSDPNDNDRMSDRYVEDGSYLRVKNVSLGYTFPKSFLTKMKVDNIRLYCNIQNLYTFTKYRGYDPEVGASTQDSTGLTFGVDNGRYPSPMTCSFGVNLTF